MGLCYFPDPLPDELLYSVLARYKRHVGYSTDACALRALFGRRHQVPTLDLPIGLARLSARLGARWRRSPTELATNMTLLPYHTAFVGRDEWSRGIAAMSGDKASPHLFLGIAASRVPRVAAPRLCPDCAMDDRTAYGEACWRRSHQLPGTIVCPSHAIPLWSAELASGRSGRHELLSAEEALRVGVLRQLFDPAPEALPVLIGLAQASANLLSARRIDPGERHQAIVERLRSRGLARSAMKIDQRRLGEVFMDKLGSALPYLPMALAPGGLPGEWLAAMARKQRKAVHPLFHVVIDLILDGVSEIEAAFGDGPWTCVNPSAEHYGMDVVASVAWAKDGARRTATFRCECGYAYTRSLLPDGSHEGPRLLEYGPTLQPALRRLVAGGCSLRETGRRLGVDPKTVMTAAQAFGINVPWRTRASGKSLSHAADRRARIVKVPAPRLDRPVRRSPMMTEELRSHGWSSASRRSKVPVPTMIPPPSDSGTGATRPH